MKPTFLKLTVLNSKGYRTEYINMNTVESMHEVKRVGETHTALVHQNSFTKVKETPEEILQMLNL